jgi:hypothetical protein
MLIIALIARTEDASGVPEIKNGFEFKFLNF